MQPYSKPVSYTHLDVYKRQVQDFSAFANAFGRPGGAGPVRRDHGMFNLVKVRISEFTGNFIMAGRIAPVSYTHLDVYKRQLLSCFFSRMSKHPSLTMKGVFNERYSQMLLLVLGILGLSLIHI